MKNYREFLALDAQMVRAQFTGQGAVSAPGLFAPVLQARAKAQVMAQRPYHLNGGGTQQHRVEGRSPLGNSTPNAGMRAWLEAKRRERQLARAAEHVKGPSGGGSGKKNKR